MTDEVVRVTGLTRRYGEVTAVGGIDLAIGAGEVVALLGPNGAGKSTTIDMMLGLTRPDAGTVTVFGLAPIEAIRAGRVGALLQSGGLLPDLTVAEIVSLSAALHGHRGPIGPVLERAGVAEFAKRRVSVLSGGQQQRVRFAMALVGDPDLIILDEPTTGLDVEARRAFWAAMREETRRGRTVLFATHYLDEADAYADRIVLLRADEVRISDDGRGPGAGESTVDRYGAGLNGGAGLRGLRERVETWGGSLTVGRSATGGFDLSVRG